MHKHMQMLRVPCPSNLTIDNTEERKRRGVEHN